jgi:hypothetical protein
MARAISSDMPRGMRSRFLPILRENDGSFLALGESDMPEANGAEGRIVGILPQNAPDIREYMQARLRMRQTGLMPDGINPEWNSGGCFGASFRTRNAARWSGVCGLSYGFFRRWGEKFLCNSVQNLIARLR